MEHVDDPETFLKNIRDCTKDEGLIFLSTMNKTPQSFFKTIVGAEMLLKLVPKGNIKQF
jgi:2-polyprenyl-6-hydroxyphenyl methylase/3-demethylubiquinone-9 3-methyltransferase